MGAVSRIGIVLGSWSPCPQGKLMDRWTIYHRYLSARFFRDPWKTVWDSTGKKKRSCPSLCVSEFTLNNIFICVCVFIYIVQRRWTIIMEESLQTSRFFYNMLFIYNYFRSTNNISSTREPDMSDHSFSFDFVFFSDLRATRPWMKAIIIIRVGLALLKLIWNLNS